MDIDYKEKFAEILKECRFMALATSDNDVPDVRLMDCLYSEKYPDRIFIVTDINSYKVKQFEKNSNVAVATISKGDHRFIRAIDAQIGRSEVAQEEIWEDIKDKMFWLETVPEEKKKDFVLYEIAIRKAVVQYGAANSSVVEID